MDSLLWYFSSLSDCALPFAGVMKDKAQKKGDFSVALIINFLTPPSAS
ncbi:hypothetical protein UUU_41630 [Klebsiella pneumoniae subsp. pneumoniae DSM 30104 = JCM 1662 = NBRC 14940]|nr:hypothetical protein UUU_41630 [Klebsiella pneumoniae subsp. pneumoniae DSM 30104 = JCM 1662 = NBRC 14940]